MSKTPASTRFWSHARACKRLAAEVSHQADAEVPDVALQSAARLLLDASDHFGALAGARAGRLPDWLVQNAMAALLAPDGIDDPAPALLPRSR
jgi:hypothetical protein